MVFRDFQGRYQILFHALRNIVQSDKIIIYQYQYNWMLLDNAQVCPPLSIIIPWIETFIIHLSFNQDCMGIDELSALYSIHSTTCSNQTLIWTVESIQCALIKHWYELLNQYNVLQSNIDMNYWINTMCYNPTLIWIIESIQCALIQHWYELLNQYNVL